MKLIIFGLTISSSWGNGHATLWRGLCGALAARGHHPIFFEKDVPYYAASRDLTDIAGGKLVLYQDWQDIRDTAANELADTDVAIVTSYCPDSLLATELLQERSGVLRVFYDLDTPVTLAVLQTANRVAYLGDNGLRDFDLVLSYTGGEALTQLRTVLGARSVAPLYGSVDPHAHHPVEPSSAYRASLSYLGTYAEDRQQTLEQLFVEPARRLTDEQFLLGGSLFPQTFPWTLNMNYIYHVPPPEHPAFYCSSRINLNVTRGAMARMGYCPSGRLFEAAACGTPIVSDYWEGLDHFFTPGTEILVARNTQDVMEYLSRDSTELQQIGRAARQRALSEHTAERRALELEQVLQSAGAEIV